MKSLSLQAVFTNAVRGLHRQAWRKSLLNGAWCAYRTGDGRRCAIGWSITPARYSPGLEGMGSQTWAVVLAARLPAGCTDTLRELQCCHDGSHGGPEEMAARFLAFGEKYGLRWPPSVPRP